MRTRGGVAATLAAAVAMAATFGSVAAQPKYPERPVRLVVGFAAGSQPDTLARMVGEKLTATWKQPIVIDNRPGATGTLAAAAVAKAAADGHTLLWANFGLSSAIQQSLPYDPLKDFAGVAQIGYSIQLLAVSPSLGVKSIGELITLAKAHPGKMIVSAGPAGTATHLAGARFNLAAGIKARYVAFKSGAEACIETVAGRSHYCFSAQGIALPFVQDGKLVPLVVFTPQRSPTLAGVPAMAETMPEFRRPETSLGLLAPGKTPRPVLKTISMEIANALNRPDVRERMLAMGFVPAPSTPEEYDQILRAQIEALSRVAREVGLLPR
jgi:tripartite-type tricarboxylate transporter receptor subunit TctC